jgi:hypothetical protein
MEHVNSSIPPTREKFRLMSTVMFVLQDPIASLWRGVEAASWKKLCAKLFGFKEADILLNPRTRESHELLDDPTTMKNIQYAKQISSQDGWTRYGLLMKLRGLFLSLSCLIELPVLPFHVCGTYIVRTTKISQQCRTIFSPPGQ